MNCLFVFVCLFCLLWGVGDKGACWVPGFVSVLKALAAFDWRLAFCCHVPTFQTSSAFRCLLPFCRFLFFVVESCFKWANLH
jgi:hypothetical protein